MREIKTSKKRFRILFLASSKLIFGTCSLEAERNVEYMLMDMQLDPYCSYIHVYQRPREDFKRMVMGSRYNSHVLAVKDPKILFKNFEKSIEDEFSRTLLLYKRALAWSFLEPDLFPIETVVKHERAYIPIYPSPFSPLDHPPAKLSLYRSGGVRRFYDALDAPYSHNEFNVRRNFGYVFHGHEPAWAYFNDFFHNCYSSPKHAAYALYDLADEFLIGIRMINSWEALHGEPWNRDYPYEEFERAFQELIKVMKANAMILRKEDFFPLLAYPGYLPSPRYKNPCTAPYRLTGYAEYLEKEIELLTRKRPAQRKDFEFWRNLPENAKFLARAIDLMDATTGIDELGRPGRDVDFNFSRFLDIMKEILNMGKEPVVLSEIPDAGNLSKEDVVNVLRFFSNNTRGGVYVAINHKSIEERYKYPDLAHEMLLHGKEPVQVDMDLIRNVCYETLVKLEPDLPEEIGADLFIHPKNQLLVRRYLPHLYMSYEEAEKDIDPKYLKSFPRSLFCLQLSCSRYDVHLFRNPPPPPPSLDVDKPLMPYPPSLEGAAGISAKPKD